MMDAKEESVRSKKVQCLQLLLLLIPEPNYKLLKDLMGLLKRVDLGSSSCIQVQGINQNLFELAPGGHLVFFFFFFV